MAINFTQPKIISFFAPKAVRMNKVEVCFSPKLYEHRLIKENFIAVVADIFRATTTICAALDFGIAKVIPVAGLEAAREMKEKGYLVACERDGQLLDFADIGNSPSDFLKPELRGKEIVFSTTNGTKAINMAAAEATKTLVGAFMNVKAIAQFIIKENRNAVILCASWKNLFNLEDTLFAGALADELLSGGFETECDSVKAAIDLWQMARLDLPTYLRKSSHRNRLNHLLSEDDYLLSLKVDSSRIVPEFRNGELIPEKNV